MRQRARETELLRKRVTQLERAIVALVMLAGGNVLIPDDLLMLAGDQALASMQEIDGVRLMVP